MKKRFWPFFSYNRVIEYDKSQRTLCKSPRGNWSLTAEVIRSNFKKSKRLLKTNFWKKNANFPVKKRFWSFFLVKSSVTNLKGQFVRVQKVFRELLWKLLDHFCNTWEVVGKHKILKEKGNLSSEGKFLAFFFVLSNMENVRQRLIRAHKVLWQVFCKLYDRFFRT